MMAGLGGLGAAVGGFAQGAAQGLKLRSELEDAESKRKYMGLQTEKLQQEVDTGKEFKELQTAMADETKNYASGTGVYAPAEGQKYDPTNPNTVDTYYARVGSMAARQAVLANKNPLEVEEFMNKARKEKFSERVMQATALLKAGDESGFEMLKPVYNKMFNDGRELVAGKYNKDNDSYDLTYKDKDGAERNYNVNRAQFTESMLPLALNPADAAKFHMQSKELEQQKALKERELTGIENYRTESLKIEKLKADQVGSHYKAMESYYKQLGSAAVTNATTNKDAVNQQRIANALQSDLGQISVLSGVQRNFDPTKASDTDITNQKAALFRTNLGMNIYTLNIKDGKPQITPDQAVTAANGNPKDYTVRDGRVYYKLGDKEIFVPIGLDQAAALGVPGTGRPEPAAPAKPDAPRKPGIRMPGLSVDDQAAGDLAYLQEEQERQKAASRGIAQQYK